MKKIITTSFIVLLLTVGFSTLSSAGELNDTEVDVNNESLVDIDIESLGIEGTLKIDDEMIENGIKYHYDDKVYDVNLDGTLTYDRIDLVPFWTQYNLSLDNGRAFVKKWHVGKVWTSFICGRMDEKTASRTQYIYNHSTGKYVYYNDIVSARGGVSMTMPQATQYSFGLVSRQQQRTNYYFTVNF